MNKKFLGTVLLGLIGGGCFYLLHHEYVMIIFPLHYKKESPLKSTTQRTVTLFIPDVTKGSYTQEQATFKVATTNNNHEYLIKAWLAAQPEAAIDTDIEKVALSPDQKSIFIHFAKKSPFTAQASTYDKLMWAQALLTTIHGYNEKIEYVYFLVNNHPLIDYELDFSKPWPIEGFLSTT